jgi:hypothetical protein
VVLPLRSEEQVLGEDPVPGLHHPSCLALDSCGGPGGG